MSRQDMRSIGIPFLLSLALVASASTSARLYKENKEIDRAQAAQVQSQEIVCVLPGDPLR